MIMNETKKTVEYVNKTKQDAMKYLAEAQEDVALWTMVVNECDTDIKAAHERERDRPMYGKARLVVMAVIAIVLAAIFVSGCQTLKGVTGDSGWILTKLSDNIQTQEK
jgi:predicted small secreted protein